MRNRFRIPAFVGAALLLAAAGQAPMASLAIAEIVDTTPRLAPAAPALVPLPAEMTEFAAPDLGLVMPEADSLSELVQDVKAISDSPLDTETRCLATTVYYESKGEPLSGQLAVAQVVLNRLGDGRFGQSICSVVTAPKQFSFVRNGEISAPAANAQWQTAKAIALIAVSNSWPEVVPDATHFHATRVSPGWKLQRLATVGRHIFYR